MGLEAFDVAPDNKGGRKKKEGEETDERWEPHGDPFTNSKDTDEEWWAEKAKEACAQYSFVEDSDGSFSDDFFERREQIGQLASWVHLSSVEARKKMAEAGFYETDWEEFIDKGRDAWMDHRIPGYEQKKKKMSALNSFGSSSSSSGSSDDDEEEESSSGLLSVVNNAK